VSSECVMFRFRMWQIVRIHDAVTITPLPPRDRWNYLKCKLTRVDVIPLRARTLYTISRSPQFMLSYLAFHHVYLVHKMISIKNLLIVKHNYCTRLSKKYNALVILFEFRNNFIYEDLIVPSFAIFKCSLTFVTAYIIFAISINFYAANVTWFFVNITKKFF
jgi:hypothetical protein